MSTGAFAVADLQDRLARDGYAVVETFITAEEVGQLLEAFRAHDCAAHHGAWSASMFSSDVEYRAAVNRAIIDVLTPRATLLLPEYRFCICNFLVKEANQPAEGVVQVHQDPSFVDEDQFSSVGVWIPLVDTDMSNGGIAVLPGSHRWNSGPRSFGGWSPYWQLSAQMLEQAQPLQIRAGSALVFSQKLFHGSPTNRSEATRVSAAALLVSKEAPLRCYYADPETPRHLAVFEVDDLFYTRYPYATRPEGVPQVATVERAYEDIVDHLLLAGRAA